MTLLTALATSTPLPVIVRNTASLPIDVQHLPPPDFLAWAVLVVSAALAIVTGGLFWVTRNMASETHKLAKKTADMADQTAELARDTVDASDRADEHHQQSLWPLPLARNARVDLGRTGVYLYLDCKNVGGGPIERGRVRIVSFNGVRCAGNIGTDLPPLGTGETEDVTVSLAMLAKDRKDNDYLSFEIEYSTMFDSWGATLWKLSIGTDENRHDELTWLSPGRRPQIVKRPRRQSE